MESFQSSSTGPHNKNNPLVLLYQTSQAKRALTFCPGSPASPASPFGPGRPCGKTTKKDYSNKLMQASEGGRVLSFHWKTNTSIKQSRICESRFLEEAPCSMLPDYKRPERKRLTGEREVEFMQSSLRISCLWYGGRVSADMKECRMLSVIAALLQLLGK